MGQYLSVLPPCSAGTACTGRIKRKEPSGWVEPGAAPDSDEDDDEDEDEDEDDMRPARASKVVKRRP